MALRILFLTESPWCLVAEAELVGEGTREKGGVCFRCPEAGPPSPPAAPSGRTVMSGFASLRLHWGCPESWWHGVSRRYVRESLKEISIWTCRPERGRPPSQGSTSVPGPVQSIRTDGAGRSPPAWDRPRAGEQLHGVKEGRKARKPMHCAMFRENILNLLYMFLNFNVLFLYLPWWLQNKLVSLLPMMPFNLCRGLCVILGRGNEEAAHTDFSGELKLLENLLRGLAENFRIQVSVSNKLRLHSEGRQIRH